MSSIFETLNKIDVNGFTEKKNGLTYLSWAHAWKEVKRAYPTANYVVYENDKGWNYFTDGKTAWVKTGVVIEEIEHIEYLPIMDYRNKSITLDKITSFDVNKAIQRSLTKAVARHGLGLYIYAGEDLPEPRVDDGHSKQPNSNNTQNVVQAKQGNNNPQWTPITVKDDISKALDKELQQEDMKRIFTACKEAGLDLINDYGDKRELIIAEAKSVA
jgi:hypothetical protein